MNVRSSSRRSPLIYGSTSIAPTWSRCPRLLRRRVLSPALRDRAPV